jgi:hypothetical protein
VRILKIITINVITFMILLVIVNWACGKYLKSAGAVHRDALPNYADDPAYAKQIFTDYNSVQHHYEPFVGWQMAPYSGRTLTISKNGERMHSAPSCVSKNRKSVHFFGGSTMWGEGSDDDHTIPALFNEINPQYEVFNHAQLAYNSRQELDALISLYSTGASPDIVVFYDGVNDAAFLCPKEIKKLPAHRLVPMYTEKLYAGRSAMIKDLATDIFVENIIKAVQVATYKPDPSRSPYDCVSNPMKAEQIAEMMIKNWEMAHDLVTSRNGKFVAFLQPAAFIGKPKTDHLKLDDDLGKNFQAIYGHLKSKLAARKYSWVIDLTDKFDGDKYVYIDFCHVSPNGNAIISKEISKALNDENKIADVSLLAIYP